MSPTSLLQEFQLELKKCWLLSDEDRAYWLLHAAELPSAIVEGVLKVVKEKNALLEHYFRVAYLQDPGHEDFQKLQTKIKTLKRKTRELTETEQTPDAEALLQEKLANL